MNYQKLKKEHTFLKEAGLTGRWIHLDHIKPLFEKHRSLQIKDLGRSVENREIYSIQLGTGPIRILAWSQMHGNESTTTKALFDLLNFLGEKNAMAVNLLKKITLLIIPILNPDGALRYTRFNANEVDLNRDAQALTQPESSILKEAYTTFKPHFAFNLHGQRTIFGVGEPPRAATVSLLSPAPDAARTITPARARGMGVIASIHAMLQEVLPNATGRYDDSFNINCVGDTLQHLDVATILFEAGHFREDYEREQTRVYIYLALICALKSMAFSDETEDFSTENYFNIPENKKCFYDFIVRNVSLPKHRNCDIAVQFEEKIDENGLKFVPKIEKIGDLGDFNGHKEFDFKGKKPAQPLSLQWEIGEVLLYLSANSEHTITFSVKQS